MGRHRRWSKVTREFVEVLDVIVVMRIYLLIYDKITKLLCHIVTSSRGIYIRKAPGAAPEAPLATAGSESEGAPMPYVPAFMLLVTHIE